MDLQCLGAQKRFFLQRQKSVSKRDCTVRRMRPPQGPAFARFPLRIHVKKKTKNKKTQVCVRFFITIKHFRVFTVCTKMFFCDKEPYENLSFFRFFVVLLRILKGNLTQAGP